MPKKLHVRRRRLPNSFGARSRTFARTSGGPWAEVGSTDKSRDFRGIQETVSEGHHWPSKKSAKNDEGGPFFTTKSWIEYVPSTYSTYLGKKTAFGPDEYRFTGHLLSVNPGNLGFGSPFFPKVPGSSDANMDAFGTTAIAAVNPVNSVAELSTALGEIVKDGLPRLPGISLWEKRLKPFLGVSEEFLNLAFAWAPLVNDIKETSDAIRFRALVLKQYERDAGKVVRRSYQFPLIKSVTEVSETGRKATATTIGSRFDDDLNTGTLVTRTESSIRRWFDGAFTYYIPSEKDNWRAMMGAASQADKLFGLNPDPQTLWELTPWSWAIDWFTNAGDVISNISDFVKDGSIMRYGYVMEESITRVTYSLTGKSGLRWFDPTSESFKPIPLSAVGDVTVVTVTKKRRPANPYGFGVSWEGLSTFQLAILAALGITRFS